MKEKFKLTPLEKSWILYDIANSAFVLLAATLIPIFFNAVAGSAGLSETQYLSYWGYAGSISTLLVAFIGPVCGALTDQRGLKKPIFLITILLGAVGCAALGFAWSWLAFLAIFVIAKVGFSSSIVFYDSMLPEITTEERMDKVSSMGYAYGYIGSVIPFLVCLVLVLFYESFGISQTTAMMIAFSLTAVWWILASLPLLKQYKQTASSEPRHQPVRQAFRQLWETLKHAMQHKHIILYLAAVSAALRWKSTIIWSSRSMKSILKPLIPILE
jgi:UMF1 family MFS transporter